MDKKALTYALKLLSRRDYTRQQMRQRLERRFGMDLDSILEWLEGRSYLDDHRFARSFVASHRRWGPLRMEAELEQRGITETVRRQVLTDHVWPSVSEVMGDRMVRLRLRPPITKEAAAQIGRTLSRLGYEPSEIEEEIEKLL